MKYLPDFAEATAATLAQPCLKQVQESGSQTTHLGPIASEAMTVAEPPATENVDAEHFTVAATPSDSAVEAPAIISAPAELNANETTTRTPRQCRTCGLASNDWRQYHMPLLPPIENGKRMQTRFLPNGNWRHCTVPESQRLPGFPCPEGKKLPYKRRTNVTVIKLNDLY